MHPIAYLLRVMAGRLRLLISRPRDYHSAIEALYWEPDTITYRIMGAGTALTMDMRPDPSAVDFTPEQVDSIIAAMALWRDAVPSRPIVRYSQSQPGVMIDFVRKRPADGSLGQTRWWTREKGGNVLGRVIVELSPDLAGDAFAYIAAHESGHALGIRGHSPYPGDLMFPSRSGRFPAPALSARDIATIQRVTGGAIEVHRR